MRIILRAPTIIIIVLVMSVFLTSCEKKDKQFIGRWVGVNNPSISILVEEREQEKQGSSHGSGGEKTDESKQDVSGNHGSKDTGETTEAKENTAPEHGKKEVDQKSEDKYVITVRREGDASLYYARFEKDHFVVTIPGGNPGQLKLDKNGFLVAVGLKMGSPLDEMDFRRLTERETTAHPSVEKTDEQSKVTNPVRDNTAQPLSRTLPVAEDE